MEQPTAWAWRGGAQRQTPTEEPPKRVPPSPPPSRPPFLVASERNDKRDVQVASVQSTCGSVGHPEFCWRPCLAMVRHSGCPNGRQCEFCHHPHGRPVKLDKQQRLALRSLSEREKLNLVLPLLKVRAAQVPQATRVIDLMEQHLACLEVPEHSRSNIPPRKLGELSRLMSRMSFRCLMQICPCSNLDSIQSAFLEVRHSYAVASAD